MVRAVRHRTRDEGSMTLEAVLALAFLLTVAAAGAVLFGAMATATMADSMIQRASWRLDAEGMLLAVDKNEYVRAVLAEGAPAQVADTLEVSNARVDVEKEERESLLGSEDSGYGIYALSEERQTAVVSYDVSYMPDLLVFGEAPQQSRHVERKIVLSRKAEVS